MFPEIVWSHPGPEHIEKLKALSENDDVLRKHLRKIQEAWKRDKKLSRAA